MKRRKRPYLPGGWRWLQPGETVIRGDVVCEKKPHAVRTDIGWVVEKEGWPVRRHA